MRLPRCLVVILLTASGLALPGAGAWWWVTWPERTAREWFERRTKLTEQREQRERDEPIRSSGLRPIRFFPKRWCDVTPQSGSIMDLVTGCQRFTIYRGQYAGFSVERGLVLGVRDEDVLLDVAPGS
jgi:hypothetical protein